MPPKAPKAGGKKSVVEGTKKKPEKKVEEEEAELEPSLWNVLDQKTLKWIFVGGKGGVGKTTCSCSLAVQLAARRDRVLLISTDPAHNISDAFSQKFNHLPEKVNGFDNLFAMEIDPGSGMDGEMMKQLAGAASGLKELMGDVLGGLPGMDEAMTFAEIIKLIDSLSFSVVVFDTAPTGHTLRLLQFPGLIEKAMEKLSSLTENMGGLFTMASQMMGMCNMTGKDVTGALQEILHSARNIQKQFKEPNITTFVCVCIAEFLSVYETERLIQELMKLEIDTRNLIVNQLLFPDRDEGGCTRCKKCGAREAIQAKYLEQIKDLYFDFHVTRLPLLEKEVRGPDALKTFSRHLVQPFESD